jgi:tetratricopeptide (TPR) repeat protein
MKKIAIISLLLVGACELLDPTEVVNPNVTEDTFLDLPRISTPWLNGLERQLAITMNQNVVLGELLSDNYFNNRTLTNKVFDIPQIEYTDIDVMTWQSEVHTLRRMAQYALETVSEADETTTNDQRAEFHFFLGLAHLFGGEYFTGLPAEEGGVVLESEAHYTRAVEQFEAALQLSTDAEALPSYRLALARTHHHLGNRSEATARVNAALTADPLYIRSVVYDVNLQNDMQFYLYGSEANEFAPLPRLDFLDPKYFHTDNPSLERKPIALFKIEEAYFIRAEAQLAEGALTESQATLTDLINTVIAERPVVPVSDADNRDGGTNANVGIPDYPLDSTYVVFVRPGAPQARSGLIEKRPGVVRVPTVSGTSVTPAMVAATTTVDELLRLLCLMRQEVFIAEGRRVVDLGIKVPVAENELTGNDNVEPDDLTPQVPTFYPAEDYAFDQFVIDTVAQQITISYDLNEIMVANKTAIPVIPFF